MYARMLNTFFGLLIVCLTAKIPCMHICYNFAYTFFIRCSVWYLIWSLINSWGSKYLGYEYMKLNV